MDGEKRDGLECDDPDTIAARTATVAACTKQMVLVIEFTASSKAGRRSFTGGPTRHASFQRAWRERTG